MHVLKCALRSSAQDALEALTKQEQSNAHLQQKLQDALEAHAAEATKAYCTRQEAASAQAAFSETLAVQAQLTDRLEQNEAALHAAQSSRDAAERHLEEVRKQTGAALQARSAQLNRLQASVSHMRHDQQLLVDELAQTAHQVSVHIHAMSMS